MYTDPILSYTSIHVRKLEKTDYTNMTLDSFSIRLVFVSIK